MIETINGKAYFKVGDKVYELGGGSNIITADSVEQLPDPASVPEGTIALVKGEGESGGGGLPTVELTTPITTPEAAGEMLTVTLTDAEYTLIDNVAVTASPFILRVTIDENPLFGIVTGLFVDGVGSFYTEITFPIGALCKYQIAIVNFGDGWNMAVIRQTFKDFN